jgi:ATP-dependent RNA helicase RhlB
MDTHLTATRFADLPLHPHLADGLATAGFTFCTPIQALTLPVALAGEDVAGQAQTGTGKTAAFLLALLDRLLREPAREDRKPGHVRALVLAPTRELAIQIHRDAMQLASGTALRLALIYGGVDYDRQRAELQAGTDIIIGTPGRIIDYAKQKVFDLSHIEVCVLDEADRMFDLGFIKDIRWLLRRMPEAHRRLNMLFSATLSHRVLELAYEHMNSPKTLTVEADRGTADAVTQVLYHVERSEKLRVLMNLMARSPDARSLVFCNTKRAAEKVNETLNRHGFAAEVLSGDVPQRKRQKLIGRIARGELPNLVATDVAARGLHIPDVSHVYNYDLPQNAEDYVHRIGRTARAGASGDAISLACEEYVYSLMDIEEYIGHRLPVERVTEDLTQSVPKMKRVAPVFTDQDDADDDVDDAPAASLADAEDPEQADADTAEGAGGLADAAPKKKRRRRRRSSGANRTGSTVPSAPVDG